MRPSTRYDLMVYLPTFSDVKALSVTLPRNIEYGLRCFDVEDGRYHGFKRPIDNSEDGTRQLLLNYCGGDILIRYNPNGLCYEYQKFNQAKKFAASIGFRYMVMLGSDEWLTGDIDLFLKELDKRYTNESIIYELECIEHQPKSKYNRKEAKRLPKIFVNPGTIVARDIHWFYFVGGSDLPHMTPTEVIPGAVLHHDDSIRDPKRNKEMEKFQDKDVLREDKIIKKQYTKRIVNEIEYPPTISRSGGLYFTCGCIKISGTYTKKCKKHEGKASFPKFDR